MSWKEPPAEGPRSGEVEEPTYEPLIYRITDIPHSYGGIVRALFMLAAVIMLLGAPFYVDDLQSDLPFVVGVVIALVCFAALTTPWKQTVVFFDALVAGVGFVVFELWALTEFTTAPPLATLLRQVLAIIFMFSFYFSVKTFRALLMHQVDESIGESYRVPDEDDSAARKEERAQDEHGAKEQERAQREADEFLD